jgi:uncharacterized damage-inducible protein DinB
MTLCRLAVALMGALAALAQDPTAFKREYLQEFEHVVKQTVQLAEAIPAEKYSWRPGDGVRSVSEVLMHIATGNHLLLGITGATPPKELYPSGRADIRTSRELEKKMTDKGGVVSALKASFDAVRTALNAGQEFDKPVKFFGSDSTVRGVYLRILIHANEHMGQSIAYARTMGVVPPWSKAAQ